MSRKPLGKFLSITALLVLILSIGAISYFRLLDYYELASLDFRFVFRYPKIPTTDNVVFIEIGEDTIEKLGRFPFDRNYHAAVTKALSEHGAKMALFDLLFSEPHEHDKEMEFALNQAGNVYLPSAFDLKTKGNKVTDVRGYIAECMEGMVSQTKGTGHINIVPDQDGKFRRIPLFLKYEDTFYPYISFAMACDYLEVPLKDIKIFSGRYIIAGKRGAVPIDEDSNMIINYSGRWGASYRHYSYVDVLQSYFAASSGQQPILDLEQFRGKICIVGLTASGTGDVHPNPFEPIYPGMGIHAEIINSMINKNFVTRASRFMNLGILAVLGLYISLITFKMKPIKGFSILTASILFFIVVTWLLFSRAGLWVDMVYPVFAMVLLFLVFTLRKYIAEWRNRVVLENELGIAKKIQESFLPKKTPEIEGTDISAVMYTARQVGGDLYDFVDLGAHKFGVMIGDVSGKGVPASLFMAMVAGSFKSFAKLYQHPKEVLFNLNEKLVEDSASNLFVTMFYAIFDMKEKTFVYASGGHLPVAQVSSDGEVKFLDVEEGIPLGLMQGAYSGNRAHFKDGDSFIFYTDGITEAMNSKSELYGAKRLEAVLKSRSKFTSKAMISAIEKDVRHFEPKTKQHDDITVIVVRVK
jgi:CHASE2 domain-containing sensor protein